MRRKYWYLTTIFSCPVCGKSKSYRERVYKKPKYPYDFQEYYDDCNY